MMSATEITILSRGRALAQSLRQEGRVEDAQLVDELALVVERHAQPTQYATTGQVAQRLGVSRQTVVNWIRRGLMPGIQLGGRLVMPVAELGRVDELARLLDSVDAKRPPATPEEVDAIVRNERNQWKWIGKDA
jgi:excisionase family DNA binding protein